MSTPAARNTMHARWQLTTRGATGLVPTCGCGSVNAAPSPSSVASHEPVRRPGDFVSVRAVNLDDAYATVGDLARHAQTGQQEAAMWDLIDLTGREEPELAWLAAAGALSGMWWSGAMGDASEMVLRIVQRFGSDVVDRQLPWNVRFDTAVFAGAVYDGTDLLPRLFGMASCLPEDSGLYRRLMWAADRASQDGGTSGLPGNLGEPNPCRALMPNSLPGHRSL
jgi:hypothetical protein